MARLDGAVDELVGEAIDNFGEDALVEDLVALRRHIDRLEADFNRRLNAFWHQQRHLSDVAASLTSWLRVKCRLSTAAASQHADAARQLPDLPLTADALRSGAIGFHHAAVIARCAAEVGADKVRPTEQILIEAAQKLDPGRLRLVTRHLRHCVDPDGALEASNDDHAHRWFHISQTYDGVFVLDGKLDAEGGALLRTAIDALEKPAAGDDRNASQRRADALVELASRQLRAGALPEVNGQRPHLTITAPLATVEGVKGAPAGELAWAGPVVAETVRRLACDAAVTRVTLAENGEPLNVGRATRSIPPAIRRALVARDGGCRFPGCDRPPEWTDGHHIKHWADGGDTKLDNLVLLCRRHHRPVHEHGWGLAWRADHSLASVPP